MEYNVIFTVEMIKNLQVFLERTSLSGAEVPAYMTILQALNKAQPHTSEEKDNK